MVLSQAMHPSWLLAFLYMEKPLTDSAISISASPVSFNIFTSFSLSL